MTFTYDPTNDIGRVRRTIPDKVDGDYFWTDEEIQSFLDDEGGSWRRASALALETMASDDLLVLKAVRVQNLETNVDRTAKILLERAKQLRVMADSADVTDNAGFEIAEFASTEHQYRERVYNYGLKEVI